MRTILKIIAAPFVVILTVMVAVFAFLFALSERILNYVSGLLALAGIALMIISQDWLKGGVILFIASLASPVGIPAVAEWLIGKLDSLNYLLRSFITN
jgi:hypothetical protein